MLQSFLGRGGRSCVWVTGNDGTGEEGLLAFGVGVVAVSMAMAVTAVGGMVSVVALVKVLATTRGVTEMGSATASLFETTASGDMGGLTMVAVALAW